MSFPGFHQVDMSLHVSNNGVWSMFEICSGDRFPDVAPPMTRNGWYLVSHPGKYHLVLGTIV